MPVYSMTGYASVQHSTANTPSTPETKALAATRVGLEIRAVNSRFLDLSFRLPEDLRQSEPGLRELLISKLKRGKVEVRAFIESAHSTGVKEPSASLLQRLNLTQDSIRSWLPEARPLGVVDVLLLAEKEHGGSQDWGEDILALAETALNDLLQARQREGTRLVAMLTERLDQLRSLAAQANPLVPKLVEQQRQRFLDRWKEAMALTEDSSLPASAQDRALSEATAFAIRIDVAEEISRLNSHLAEIERLLKKGGEVGKRLDFLIQELHREANTLGAKSSALELTHISVDMKVLIEQMREQVQNLE
ncbi:MAG: YicC family protein [Rhodoferax sp.]|nr:YicC family protein [Rhodoferax sp.]